MNEPIVPPPLPEPLPADRAVGITTTIPVEVVFAAGLVPVDLNNLFVTARDPGALVQVAERAGFPTQCCCWTKGLYGAVRGWHIGRVIGVTQGDCSNTNALMEVLCFEGTECIPFEFPYEPDPARLSQSIARLAAALGADLQRAEKWRERLAPIRAKAHEIDLLTWQEGKVTGRENHLWLVSTSDFCADPDRYVREADRFLSQAAGRRPIDHRVRLGFAGVPPIVPGLYDLLESLGALVVYNETQRQFAMPQQGPSLADQYTRYTYPYGIFTRLSDIRRQCKLRSLDGIVHYVQSFCFRRIEDRILREALGMPVLTVECDLPGQTPSQLTTRLEAFVEMLEDRRQERA